MVVAYALALTMFQAPASEGSVGVLPLRVDAELAAPDRRDAADHFSQGLARAGLAVEPVRVEGADTCTQAECYRTLAAASGATRLAGASLTQNGPDFQVEAFVVDGATGETLASVDGVCEICGMTELDDMIEGLAARLRSKLDTTVAPARLRVSTRPAGASVVVDGVEVGASPVDTTVTPGSHRIAVRHPGYREVDETTDIESGATAELDYRLERQRNIPAWVPWTLIAVGAGATVSGVALLAIDGREVRRDCNADIDGRCEFVHDTLPGGIVLTVGGIGSLGAGIALAAIRARSQRGRSAQARRPNERRIRASAWLTTPGLTISGRF